ncbi:MAG TPA: HAMP domain-containing sensor histidine kinase [Candidatus Dormibacteraeota bacterium]
MGAVALAAAVLLLRAPWAAPLPLAILPLVYRSNRLLESELESRQQLASLLAAQRRFLTDVSHNVGNPLSTIRTNLSRLGRAHLRAAERDALADAAAESQRLGELFRRLRVLAETDEHVPIRLSDFDLAIMAGELVRAYSSQASARGVELRMEAAAESSVRGDEDLLRQAAANLVENAIRYSPDGGAVVIRVAADTRQARIEVIDQGPGIDPLRLPAIFDRFQTGPGGGSGLGLAIAQSVVERHGGRIEVESRLGVGSRFAILLPAG